VPRGVIAPLPAPLGSGAPNVALQDPGSGLRWSQGAEKAPERQGDSVMLPSYLTAQILPARSGEHNRAAEARYPLSELHLQWGREKNFALFFSIC